MGTTSIQHLLSHTVPNFKFQRYFYDIQTCLACFTGQKICSPPETILSETCHVIRSPEASLWFWEGGLHRKRRPIFLNLLIKRSSIFWILVPTHSATLTVRVSRVQCGRWRLIQWCLLSFHHHLRRVNLTSQGHGEEAGHAKLIRDEPPVAPRMVFFFLFSSV